MSPLYPIVVRSIAAGNWSHAAVRALLAEHDIAGEKAREMLTSMHREHGLICSRHGGWAVSMRGMRLLPGAAPVPMRPYVVPVPPPRRRGSEVASGLPSMAAGTLRWRA